MKDTLSPCKGTDQTKMMSKPAYLSVEIVTDKPTSGKISIPQIVSVAEQTGLSLTWSQTQYLCKHACLSTLHFAVFVICTSFKKYICVSDWVRVHVYTS